MTRRSTLTRTGDVATLVIAAAAVLVYVWSLAESQRVEDVLFLFTASIYAEPWRVLTSAAFCLQSVYSLVVRP